MPENSSITQQTIDAMPTGLLTPTEAARLMSVTKKVLERWRSVGNGPAFVRLTAKTIRYRHADVAAFVIDKLRANTAA
jgi:hypothetical protein